VITLALHRPEVRLALESASMRLADGAAIAWLQRRLGTDDAQRVGGPDLMPRVIDIGRAYGLRHFLLGSTPDVLARVEWTLVERYPGATIAGRQSPPFSDEPVSDLNSIDEIREATPHIVWCALGAPKQELWMRRNTPHLPEIVIVGVGAAFDFLAETKARAPMWMQNAGLEWAHRFMSEPRRLGRRYVRCNSELIVRSAFELSRRRLVS
jgi:N-acetylglucosaminyldiphosphoundecaprenol N-acetyl-beta-D-mannosaminyltransferase